jgi:hypothetical protein
MLTEHPFHGWVFAFIRLVESTPRYICSSCFWSISPLTRLPLPGPTTSCRLYNDGRARFICHTIKTHSLHLTFTQQENSASAIAIA